MLGVGDDVTDVVSHLIGLTQMRTQGAPGFGVAACGLSAGHGGGFEEGAGLQPLVFPQGDARFTFPGLAGHDATRHADTDADGVHHPQRTFGRVCGGTHQHLEGHDDQRVAHQHRQALAEGAVHRRLATARGRVVKTRQVVVHQRRAVQQLDGGSGGVGQRGPVVTACAGHRQAQLRADARTARKHGVVHGCRQLGRAAMAHAGRHGGGE